MLEQNRKHSVSERTYAQMIKETTWKIDHLH